MAMVSSYFSRVGIQLDRGALRSTQAYFRNIERIMTNFQRRATRMQSVNLRFRVDRTQVNRQLQTTMNRLSKNIVVPITRFQVNQKGLKRAFNKALPANFNQAGSVRIGLRIARSSLTHMRDQVRQALEGTTIRPRIAPRTMRGTTGVIGRGGGSSSRAGDGGTHLDPRNTRRQSPWHNPMMIGGGAGAFMRYGFYSLPFVGGVLGLNAMSNTLREYRAQETGLSFASSLSSDPSKDVSYFREYLEEVGSRTGIRESLLSRDFHQMLAGSAGTDMEPHLEEGFLGLTQYASILGLSEDSMRLVMRGVTQMIGKGKIQA